MFSVLHEKADALPAWFEHDALAISNVVHAWLCRAEQLETFNEYIGKLNRIAMVLQRDRACRRNAG